MKRNIFYIGIIITFGAVLYFYNPASNKYTKCPDDYADTDAGTAEYRNALIDWTSEYLKANPKATMSDWSKAKLDLWRENNCGEALERLKLSGKVSDLKHWELVDYEVQNVLEEYKD